MTCIATSLDGLILTYLIHGHSHEKWPLELCQCKSGGAARKSAWHISWRGPKKSCPALILKVSPCNVGVLFRVSLLPSHHSKGNLTLGTFKHLGKVIIMSNLVNWLTFEFIYVVFKCLVVRLHSDRS